MKPVKIIAKVLDGNGNVIEEIERIYDDQLQAVEAYNRILDVIDAN